MSKQEKRIISAAISRLKNEREGVSPDVVEALGGTTVAPETDALFAYAPKVHADELPETPFDTPAQSLCERLSLIPGIRAHSFRETPTGLSGRLTDHGSGRTMDVRLDEGQPKLREVE